MADHLFFRILFWLAFLVSFAYIVLIIDILSKAVTRIQYLARKRVKRRPQTAAMLDELPEVSFVD